MPGSIGPTVLGARFYETSEAYMQTTSEIQNPVISSSNFAYKATDLVQINDQGVKTAANYIRQKILSESYTPRTWRTHPLHIVPSDPYISTDPMNRSILNWIFLISSLNFSFWSMKEGRPDRYGVEWREKWDSYGKTKVYTGYWSLVAALNRALADDGIPITDPSFYSSEALCPDSVIENAFRPAQQSTETIPLLPQRIAIMREVGSILCERFGGSFQGVVAEFHRRHNGQGTALHLVHMVAETFPPFRDEVIYNGQKESGGRVYLWKRAQILVAELWAAFFPADPTSPHPIFPGPSGPQIHRLTMFADYRVPQILHHLRILTYPPHLIELLQAGTPLDYGSREEVSLRATSIVAVERVREEILRLFEEDDETEEWRKGTVSSVLIDFYLWDLAKKIEEGQEKVDGIETADIVPIHRTRSIWY